MTDLTRSPAPRRHHRCDASTVGYVAPSESAAGTQESLKGFGDNAGMTDPASAKAVPPAAPQSASALPSGSGSLAAGSAWADADAAAAAAGVVVREAADVAEHGRICDLMRLIWSEDPNDPSITPLLLHAMSYAGNYVVVAEADGDLVGACAGFFGLIDQEWELHSHIAGVTANARGRRVGFALKTHQRAWALHRGLGRISWTFDPLVRRNAYFNLSKLAARPRAYLHDFYGPMNDGINAGDETDRLVVEWRLLDEPVVRACSGRPEEPDVGGLLANGAVIGLSVGEDGHPVSGTVEGRTVLVGVPADIERLRAIDRPSALAWRRGVRDVLGGLLGEGATITGFDRAGWYVVQRAQA